MVKVKYYGTNTFIYGDMLSKIEKLGYKGYHNQFRIVCKARSMAAANRMAASYGLDEKSFRRDYTSETGNIIELEMADKYEFIVSINGIGGNRYVGIKELL